MKTSCWIIGLLALVGCASQESAHDQEQEARARQAMGADASGLERSGVVDGGGGASPLNPPKSDFSIDL